MSQTATHSAIDTVAGHEPVLVSRAPATGEEMWRGVPTSVDDAVERARQAWPGWAAKPLTTRIELARRFANEVRAAADDLARLIAAETGKPLWDARSEIDGVIASVEIAIQAYAQRTGKRKLDSAAQGSTALRHKPHGVLAVITPFVAPAQNASDQIVPALIAGNAVLHKPSEHAPATAAALMECWHRCGVDQDVVQPVFGDADEGRALVAHPGTDGVLFTGSSHSGIAINRQLADNPGKIVALEMGGNNAIVVLKTPLIDEACALVVHSAFAGAGQRCTAAHRLIVIEDMYEPLMERLIPLTKRLLVGEPFGDPQPFMGPVIDNAAADRLSERFLALMTAGGGPLMHMTRPDPDRPFLAPGIIDTTAIAERPDLEMFGPILQVVVVPDLDAGIAEANSTRFGLSASLVGGSPEDYGRFWANTRAGLVNWNQSTHAVSPSAPLGGAGLSGNHRPGGFYTADHCAYPVASSELQQPRARVSIGIADVS